MLNFNEEYEKQLIEAFQHFVRNEPYDYSFIRPEIYDSWVRSRQFEIEYNSPVKIKKLDEKERKKLVQENAVLIETARKHLNKIYDVIKPTGYYIFISNDRGYLLDIISDKDLLSQYEYDPSLVVGASRNERYVGTNAIGTCLQEKKPMVFWGEEHYNLVHKKYTCSGAPIHGADGEIIGAMSLTGRKEDYQEHTLGIVISIVDAIEAELKSRTTKKEPSSTEYTFDNLIGQCKEIKELKEIAKQVAKIDAPILLWGESGTGKEVLAQSIHNESRRKSGPFIGINCGAIPRELIESELFGYEGGSFTGASRGGRSGKLEAASGGTLFLDEVESMPLDVQIKLLRVLSTFKVTRVGSNKEIPIDIRIISASKSDLYLEAEQGRFREDLYYRINTITLKIPPLRKRNGDIRLLADHYIERLKKDMGLNKLSIPKSFYDMLENYDWKGNVRELRNILEGVIAMSKEGEEINTSMLPDRMVNKTRNNHLRNTRLKEVEIEIIKNEIERANGNLSAAAKALGIARSTLYQKLKNNTELSEYLKK